MAAVQATPTPDEPGATSTKFIESMEDELRRVQEHLDRRVRHRSSLNSLTRNESLGEISSAEPRRELVAEGGSPLHRGSTTGRTWYTSSSASPRTSVGGTATLGSPSSSPARSSSSSLLLPDQKYSTFPLRGGRVGSAPPAGPAMPMVDSDEEDDEDDDEEDDDEEEEEVVIVAEETKWQTPVRVEESKTGAEQQQRDIDRSAELLKLKEAVDSERKLAESERHSYQQQQTIDRLEKKLKEKEQELKDIRVQYARELRSKEEKIKKLTKDTSRLEKEKWELLKRAREAAERSVNLRTKLDLHDSTLRTAQNELDRTSDELSSVKSANTSLRLLVNELRTPKDTRDTAVQTDCPPSPASPGRGRVLSQASTASMATASQLRPCSTPDELMVSLDTDSRGGTPVALSQPASYEQQQHKLNRPNMLARFRKTSGSVGGGSNRNSSSTIDSLMLSHTSIGPAGYPLDPDAATSFSPHHLSTASLQSVPEMTTDSRQVLQEYVNIPFQQWNTRALAAWMDAVVGMPRYVPTVRERVTSGHAMLALSNADMEKRLSMPHPLHRRRLRLVIEEQRGPQKGPQYPSAAELDHNWVAYQWAVDCGLPHISATLYTGMVDGRVLNSLTREDLKKYLKVSKKAEQLSFLTGVELLRMHDFRKETIRSHRQNASNPLYWTNKDVVEWLKRVDFGEYADNVLGSGIHGALLFLERGTFTSQQLASALKISSSKTQLRKKLTSKLIQLFAEESLSSSPPAERERPPPEFHMPETVAEDKSSVSPHPARRNTLAHSSSNPDLTDSPVPFQRNQGRIRMSLRESTFHVLNIPTPNERSVDVRPVPPPAGPPPDSRPPHHMMHSFLSQTTV